MDNAVRSGNYKIPHNLPSPLTFGDIGTRIANLWERHKDQTPSERVMKIYRGLYETRYLGMSADELRAKLTEMGLVEGHKMSIFNVGDIVVSKKPGEPGDFYDEYGNPTVVTEVAKRHLVCEDGTKWTHRGFKWGDYRVTLHKYTDEVKILKEAGDRRLYKWMIRVNKCNDSPLLRN